MPPGRRASRRTPTYTALFGRLGTELALFGASAVRHDPPVQHSDLVEGQAVAFAQADGCCWARLYAGLAYVDGRPFESAGSSRSTLRWLVIFAIVVVRSRRRFRTPGGKPFNGRGFLPNT